MLDTCIKLAYSNTCIKLMLQGSAGLQRAAERSRPRGLEAVPDEQGGGSRPG